MTHIHRLNRLATYWRSAERFVLGLSIIMMSLLVMGNVVSRQLFGASWGFTEEIGGLLLIIITFGGLSYAAEQRRHISMSAIHDILPPRGQRILARTIDTVTGFLMLGMAYIALRYVVQIFESGDTSNVLRIPMFIVLIIIPLGFLLTAIRYLSPQFTQRLAAPDDVNRQPADTPPAEE